MTRVELRTSIILELYQMSVGMLEDVQQYVRRLLCHVRPAVRVATVRSKREAAMLFVKSISVQGGSPVPADEQADCIVTRNKRTTGPAPLM